MLRARLKFQYFILGGYLLGVMVSLFLGRGLVLPRDWLEVVGLLVGGVLGWWLAWFDRVAYVLILHPEAQVSQYVRYHLGKRNYRQAWDLLEKRGGELDKLTTRGFLFQAAWLVLALFAITSVASMFGKMVVMGLGLRIMVEEWLEYRSDKALLKQRLFWQVQRQVSNQELKWYMYIGTVVFGWLTWLLV